MIGSASIALPDGVANFQATKTNISLNQVFNFTKEALKVTCHVGQVFGHKYLPGPSKYLPGAGGQPLVSNPGQIIDIILLILVICWYLSLDL